jgi:hypothetical protein
VAAAAVVVLPESKLDLQQQQQQQEEDEAGLVITHEEGVKMSEMKTNWITIALFIHRYPWKNTHVSTGGIKRRSVLASTKET